MKKQAPAVRIAGTLVDPAGAPLEDFVVEGFARGRAGEQLAGRAVSDKNGAWEIVLERGPFGAERIGTERRPDLFLRVRAPSGRVVATTEGSVVQGVGPDTHVDVMVRGWSARLGREVTSVAGEPVDPAAAAQLTRKELIDAYRYLRRGTKVERIELVRRAFPALFLPRARGDDCGESRLAFLHALLAERSDADTGLVDADDLPAGATVHWFYTAAVWVKYTTDAAFPGDAVDPTVPAADADFRFPDGSLIGVLRADLADLHPDNTEVAPTYVQKVGLLGEYALARYVGSVWVMRDPRAGAARMEFRIRQMPAGIAGQTTPTWSHVEVGPDNSDTQNFMTVPHELFHQVQYRYHTTTTRTGIYGIMREGGARLVEDSINDQPNRYVDSAAVWLNGPWQSLDDGGANNPIRYAGGLFWKYFAEQHSTRTGLADEPAIGMDSYRRVLEATATVLASDPGLGYTVAALRNARAGMPWYGRFDAFSWYDAAFTELSSHETTWGNCWIANYLHGRGVPDARFNYKEDPDAVTWPGSGVARLADLQAALTETIAIAQGGSATRVVVGHAAWAARYYRIIPGAPAPRMLRVSVTGSAGLTDPVVQILRLAPGDVLVDVHRSDRATYAKTIAWLGLAEVVVIVASRDGAGDFTLQIDEVASATDVMITRWNSAVGTEYEVSPAGWAWTWVSPDVMVDNDGDLFADGTVYFGQNNALKVRIRNRGNAPANGIGVDFWYQKATPFLTAAGWIPVQNLAGVTQAVAGEMLNAGQEKWVGVDWAPVDDGTHHDHWCVKVVVTVAGDPNIDNKTALSNFHVVPGGDGDRLSLLVRAIARRRCQALHVLPRGPRWTLVLDVPPAGWDERLEGGRAIAPAASRVLLEPEIASRSTLRLRAREMSRWDSKVRSPAPVAGTYYPADRRTLPPGVDSAHLVTIAQVLDGEIVGGATYWIKGEEERR